MKVGSKKYQDGYKTIEVEWYRINPWTNINDARYNVFTKINGQVVDQELSVTRRRIAAMDRKWAKNDE
jgi:hypothetical protein